MKGSSIAERSGRPSLRVFGAFPAPEPKPVETIDAKLPTGLPAGSVAHIHIWAVADAPPDALPLLFAPGLALTVIVRG